MDIVLSVLGGVSSGDRIRDESIENDILCSPAVVFFTLPEELLGVFQVQDNAVHLSELM